MKCALMSLALLLLMVFAGCASITAPDPSRKSTAEQQRDRDECAAIAARGVQDYAWDPLADLAAVRLDLEGECLESRGYVITTRVMMRPPPNATQPGHIPPDPVRRCFQQAYTWLGRYDGPIDGHANVTWRAAQLSYLTELQIMSGHADAPHLVRASLQRDLQTIGRAEEWQACLQEATKPPTTEKPREG